ncbi:chorismate synthase [Treponema sp.]|uniref:chorismate synthase n=1 Tax=Treponema sp. TaxID=166 RepID=UPI00298EA761|nr:chorismate synthase [Treponema sp.]MCR5612220.1 chorismate synthase [Treponema sp.]
MAGNTFGTNFKVTTFGESHGAALGVVIDGVPAGIKIDEKAIQKALDRRKPGASAEGKLNAAVTARKESDKCEILSGIFNGFSTGTPISIVIRNENQHSSDYTELAARMRPAHADITYLKKYGFRDYRGGGRSSGRETCARVAAGDIARQVLESILNGNCATKTSATTRATRDVSESAQSADARALSSDNNAAFRVTAYTLRAAGIQCNTIDLSQIEKNLMRAPDEKAAMLMTQKIEELRSKGDSAGGIIECRITGIPCGLGEPVFDKLDAMLAHAMLSIGAVKGIEFGKGFDVCDSTGSQNNDTMIVKDGKVVFNTNNAGGILGGISNGDTIIFRLAIKPVPSIFTEQKTVKACINPDEAQNKNSIQFEDTSLKIKGRHDVCLCPRIVPVVEAMSYITLCDMLLTSFA